MGMYRKPLIPDTFVIPNILELETCIILPLTIDYVQLDYDAVMDIHNEDGTLEYPKHTIYQNTIDLGYHQKEFQKRASFTYTILNKTKDICLGCIYIYPCDEEGYDSEVYMWIRSSYKDIEDGVMKEVREWIETVWPFKNPKFVF